MRKITLSPDIVKNDLIPVIPSPFKVKSFTLRHALLQSPLTRQQLLDLFLSDFEAKYTASCALPSLQYFETPSEASESLGVFLACTEGAKHARKVSRNRIIINWSVILSDIRKYFSVCPSYAYILWQLRDIFTPRVPIISELLQREIYNLVELNLRTTTYKDLAATSYRVAVPTSIFESDLLQYYMNQLSKDSSFVSALASAFDTLFTPVSLDNKNNFLSRCTKDFPSFHTELHPLVSVFDFSEALNPLARRQFLRMKHLPRLLTTDASWQHRTFCSSLSWEVFSCRYYTPYLFGGVQDNRFQIPSNLQGVPKKIYSTKSIFEKTGILVVKSNSEENSGSYLVIKCGDFYQYRFSTGFNRNFFGFEPDVPIDSYTVSARAELMRTIGERVRNKISHGLRQYVVFDNTKLLDSLVSSGVINDLTLPSTLVLDLDLMYEREKANGKRQRTAYKNENVNYLLGDSSSKKERKKRKKQKKRKKVIDSKLPDKYLVETYVDRSIPELELDKVPLDAVIEEENSYKREYKFRLTRWRSRLWFGISTEYDFVTELLYKRSKTGLDAKFLPNSVKLVDVPGDEVPLMLFTKKALLTYLEKLGEEEYDDLRKSTFYASHFSIRNLKLFKHWIANFDYLDAALFKKTYNRRNNIQSSRIWQPEEDDHIKKFYRPKMTKEELEEFFSFFITRKRESVLVRASLLRERMIKEGVWDIDELPHGVYNASVGRKIRAEITKRGLDYQKVMAEIREKQKRKRLSTNG